MKLFFKRVLTDERFYDMINIQNYETKFNNCFEILNMGRRDAFNEKS